jgi:xylulokinase
MHATMGVDIGTSGCKAVVFDDAGRQAAAAYREYNPAFTADGGAELDSDEVMRHCFAVIAEAAAAAAPRRVAALGISSQGEAFTALGADGRALCGAMISSDTRAVRYAREWSRDFGVERLYRITGHTAHPMFSLFKLLWLRDHRPEVWSAARKFLCFEDLLQHRLGLDPAMGWSLAARTMLFDVRRSGWDPDILSAVGLAPEQLARPLASGTVAGTLGTDMAARLGLPAGTAVVTGGHDQPCGALGAGVTEPGLAMYATGTVECITPAFAAPVFSAELQAANLCTYPHTVPGMYATVAFSLTGGNILKWFRDQFGAPEKEAAERTGRNAYELLLEAADPNPSRLLVLPYFTPTGTPYFDTRVAGAVLGLRLTSTRGEFIRALLEGVAFEMRLNLDLLDQAGCPVRELRAIGGGARSAFWNQLKADVIGKPMTTLDVTEAGCLGVAMLARSAVTGEALRPIAARWVRKQAVVVPDEARAAGYAQRFDAYRRLYPALRALPL